MNLIAYSDSEESDTETPQVPRPAEKPAPKPVFQKVVDRSNPGKIKLQLPTPSQGPREKDHLDADAPPAKKARLGGSGFSGFNSMLPAPKRPNAKPSEVASTDLGGKRGLGKKLGVGVNLKTGAEPAFRREKVEDYDEDGNPVTREERDTAPKQQDDFRAMLNLPPPKTETKMEPKPESPTGHAPAVPAVKPAAAKPRFMPLSVARGQKKKPVMARRPMDTTTEAPKPATPTVPQAPVAQHKTSKPKVSLFGGMQEDQAPSLSNAPSGDYQPLLYGAQHDETASVPDEHFNQALAHDTPSQPGRAPVPAATTSNLTNLASELNLTEAERRQLFGRKGQGVDMPNANIIEFNTDREYQHNEMLRLQGETVQHNALKSITGTGKNSLKSLINVATTQKDALEEHFAQGRRNKKEAGNKYGW